MNYHNITTDDLLNGDGLRVVLWVAGCEHHCKNCQNPITWNPDGGIEFDIKALHELYGYLEKPYIDGITFSGGDPLHPDNIDYIFALAEIVKRKYKKTVWLYTGYEWEEIVKFVHKDLLKRIDILVDGKFVEELKDVTYHWAGSTNQRVIDVQKSLETGEVVLHKNPEMTVSIYNCGNDI